MSGPVSADKERRFGRWMAVDVGSKRIGVALSDPLKLTARPETTLIRTSTGEELDELRRLIREFNVERIVVGRPLRLNGEASETVTMVESFLDQLLQHLSIEIDWAEERLSSREAETLMAQLKVPVSDRRRRRDEFAAAVILQWYIGEQRETHP